MSNEIVNIIRNLTNSSDGPLYAGIGTIAFLVFANMFIQNRYRVSNDSISPCSFNELSKNPVVSRSN